MTDMFDPRNITIPSYFFVVDSDGRAWSDTADLRRAEDLAVKLSTVHAAHAHAFYVVDMFQLRFEATSPVPGNGTPFLDAFGAVWAERPASDCRAFLLCDREATETVWNPVLGDVPSCARCAARLASLAMSDRG